MLVPLILLVRAVVGCILPPSVFPLEFRLGSVTVDARLFNLDSTSFSNISCVHSRTQISRAASPTVCINNRSDWRDLSLLLVTQRAWFLLDQDRVANLIDKTNSVDSFGLFDTICWALFSVSASVPVSFSPRFCVRGNECKQLSASAIWRKRKSKRCSLPS